MVRRLRLDELRRLWREVRRLPPPPPSLSPGEAVERDLHGGGRPRDAEKLAILAVLGVEGLLEVVEWGEARRLRLRGSRVRRGGSSRG